MKKLVLLVVAMVVLVGCSSKPSGKTLVTVNGKEITEADLEFLSNINPRIGAQIATPFGKKQVLNNLVEQEVLYQNSVKKGLQNDPNVKAKADLYKRVIIAQALVDDAIESSAKEYYEKNKNEFDKLELSHIMIKFKPAEKAPEVAKDKNAPKPPVPPAAKDQGLRSEEEALAIANKVKARLDTGEDFATVAKEVSEDAATKNGGGNLGATSKNEARFDRRGWGPILEKAFSMKVGETSGPIKTNEGYHIIIVTKGAELEPFDKVKQGIVFKLQADTRKKLLDDLKKDAKIQYAEGMAPAAPGTPPAPGAAPGEGQPPVPGQMMPPQGAPQGVPPAVQQAIPGMKMPGKPELKIQPPVKPGAPKLEIKAPVKPEEKKN